MDFIIKLVIALLVFGVIVIVHELGHFLLAKKNGVGVNEFAIGMGPKLFGIKKGETEYTIRALPLGGACMMVGEDETSNADNAFNKKSVWARISIIAAGPIFNFILAFLLALIFVGYTGWDHADIEVMDNMPAAEAGLKNGDVLTKINGKSVTCDREISYALFFNPIDSDKPVKVEYKRDGKKYKKTITPKFVKEYSITGIELNEDAKKPELSKIEKKSPFDKAGMKKGDTIVAVNGEKFKNVEAFIKYLNNTDLKRNIEVTYKRKDKEETVDVKLAKDSLSERYLLGFTYNNGSEKTNALETIKYSFVEIRVQINNALSSLKYLVSGKAKADDLSGPVGIVNFIGDGYEAVKDEGIIITIMQMISFVILLSANIGVMNLLPIPALDGGRLVFMFIEVIRRKPVKPEVEGMIHAIGLILLLILMAFVTFNDIKNIFQ